MKRLFLLHPFLIAVAPIIFLWSHNSVEVEPIDVLFPVLISLAFSSLLLMGLWLITRNYVKSAATVSLFLVFFFSYGHFFVLLENTHFSRNPLVLHLILGIYLAVFLSIIVAAIWKTSQSLQQLSSFLAILSITIILYSPIVFLNQYITDRKQVLEPDEISLDLTAGNQESLPENQESLPDIYYIILDSYSRADSLARNYRFDNSEFIAFLESRGFYVAKKSFSNYPKTIYSLSSSLNMQYLKDCSTERRFIKFLRAPLVARYLQSKGYKHVHFNTYAFESKRSDIADVTYDYTPVLGREFIRILLRTTMLMGLEKYQPTRLLAENTLYMFQKVREIPQDPAPTFTFVHFFPPHHPFIFDKYGDYVGKDMSLSISTHNLSDAYIGQLIFMNNEMQSLVDYLLKNSASQPVIIIQADHGAGYSGFGHLREADRLSILNAYYLPKRCRQDLYETITPVNSFRLILRNCFGERLEKLPDKCYIVQEGKFIESGVTRVQNSNLASSH